MTVMRKLRHCNRGAAVVAAVVTTLGAAPAADAYLTIGSGRFAMPGLGGDAAGTAYIAWNGGDGSGEAPLRFCRLPRGATVCDAGVGPTISAPNTSLLRPFIARSGDA